MPRPDVYGTQEPSYDQLIAEALASANDTPGSIPRGNTPVPKVSLEDYGIPPWLAQAYYQAQQDYENELAAVQSNGLGMSDPVAQARLSQIRSRLTSLEGQLDNYMPARQKEPTDVDRAQADYYRAQTARVGQPTPYRSGEYEYQQLQNEALRQKMMSQHEMDVREIGSMIARGEIDQAGADRMLSLSRANFEASLRGTTPFQEQNQKINTANDYFQRRMSTGNSMGQGLLSGLLGAYSKLRTSNNPPPMPDPLAMALGYTDELGGGPEMTEMARSILRGALQGGGL